MRSFANLFILILLAEVCRKKRRSRDGERSPHCTARDPWDGRVGLGPGITAKPSLVELGPVEIETVVEGIVFCVVIAIVVELAVFALQGNIRLGSSSLVLLATASASAALGSSGGGG